MGRKRATVAITGAAGQIGYALLFRTAAGEMLGGDVEVELRLLELEGALPALDGAAMELDDCAFPLLAKVVCTSDPAVAFKDVDWALLVGSVPRKAGMERSDLLKVNGGVFTVQGRAINDHAGPGARVLVVGNPCNTNALIAMNAAPDVPGENFFAMTMLDENRAKAQLARRAGTAASDVTRMAVWGNHSATQWPDFPNARIGGRPCPEVIGDDAWLAGPFVETVQKRGAAIIRARGASSAASAANAALGTVRRLVQDTPGDDWFSVCRRSGGEYGVEEGLVFSFPCRTEGGRLRVVEGIRHTDLARERIEATHRELKGERDAVREMGLI